MLGREREVLHAVRNYAKEDEIVHWVKKRYYRMRGG